MAMMAMTHKSSIKVRPFFCGGVKIDISWLDWATAWTSRQIQDGTAHPAQPDHPQKSFAFKKFFL
jgi:hypothetical protein